MYKVAHTAEEMISAFAFLHDIVHDTFMATGGLFCVCVKENISIFA